MQNGTLYYLQQVLGIRSILSQKKLSEEKLSEEKQSSQKVLFVLEPSYFQNPAEQELFQKMVAAMKLQPNEMQVVSTQDLEAVTTENRFEVGVLFCAEKAQEILGPVEPGVFVKKNLTWVLTYSPKEMLFNQAFKKPTWTHLQQVMARVHH